MEKTRRFFLFLLIDSALSLDTEHKHLICTLIALMYYSGQLPSLSLSDVLTRDISLALSVVVYGLSQKGNSQF